MTKEEQTQEATTAESIVEKAEAAAERIEAANKRMEENIKRLEQAQVERTLSGEATAGAPPKKEETDTEYANKALRGEL